MARDIIGETLNVKETPMRALDFHTDENKTVFDDEQEKPDRVVNLRPVRVQRPAENQNEFEKQRNENRREDYVQVRANLQSAIEESMQVLGDAAAECSSNPSARQFEVFAGLVKTYADLNKDLLNIHGEEAKTGKTTTSTETEQVGQVNNVLFAGDSDALVDLIRNNGKK